MKRRISPPKNFWNLWRRWDYDRISPCFRTAGGVHCGAEHPPRRRLCGRHIGRRRPFQPDCGAADHRPPYRHRPGPCGFGGCRKASGALRRPGDAGLCQFLRNGIGAEKPGDFRRGRDSAGSGCFLPSAGRRGTGLFLHGGCPAGYAHEQSGHPERLRCGKQLVL